MRKIAVVGSINMDYFVEAEKLPEIGETLLGNQFFLSVGGKGANQAVAASRLGAEVALFGSVGKDEISEIFIENMKNETLDIKNLNLVEGSHTGVAFIEICNSENRILVVPGANDFTDVSYINRVLDGLLTYDVVLFQMETPIELMEYLIPILHEKGKIIIVNPAPAHKIKAHLFEKITYLTPNEHEYEIVFDSKLPMEELLINYPNQLIITCGTDGVVYYDGQEIVRVPAIKVEPVDTTGAGDSFSGAFAVAVSEEKNLYDSIRFGTIVAGLSVTKKGAQTGMPYRSEVDLLWKEELKHEGEDHAIEN
ncbi:ribokinase [Bacillus sp. AFS002410]|uniref:ribokinase n=1 Tax=Bacillus sp. AFS002410 TaxID=2033481 RepID=UPI000BF17F39|nr:ribokinase [Bacillus sp. AFS002410]PEJ58804.1 ribokinase [Bacillus sp. AFS002410]